MDELIQRVKARYNSVVKSYKTSILPYTIKIGDITKLYEETIRDIKKEYQYYLENTNGYDMYISTEYKNSRLRLKTDRYVDRFFKSTEGSIQSAQYRGPSAQRVIPSQDNKLSDLHIKNFAKSVKNSNVFVFVNSNDSELLNALKS